MKIKKTVVLASILVGLILGCKEPDQQKNTINHNTMSHVLHKNPKELFDPTPYAFSHSTSAADKDGQYIFISGQSGAEDLEHTLSGDFRTQVTYALLNLKTVLGEYGLNPEDVLKITVLIVNHDSEKLAIWSDEMRKVWSNNEFPASTLIPVPMLALDNMLVEVDAIAYKPVD